MVELHEHTRSIPIGLDATYEKAVSLLIFMVRARSQTFKIGSNVLLVEV